MPIMPPTDLDAVLRGLAAVIRATAELVRVLRRGRRARK